MSRLNIAFVQDDIHWCNWEANQKQYETCLNQLNSSTDLLVLPEMFATGFITQPGEFAQDMKGPAVEWMKRNSADFAICGSLAIFENNQFYNRFVWCEKGEVKYTYDKHHLFSYSGEHLTFTPGSNKICINYKDWLIEPFICYDLRFPVWCRSANKAHLLIFTANWPQKRTQAWELLLKARAIENACYTLGVNRTGVDGNNLTYSGMSALNNWLGDSCVNSGEQKGLFQYQLEMSELMAYRQTFPVLDDADTFTLV